MTNAARQRMDFRVWFGRDFLQVLSYAVTDLDCERAGVLGQMMYKSD